METCSLIRDRLSIRMVIIVVVTSLLTSTHYSPVVSAAQGQAPTSQTPAESRAKKSGESEDAQSKEAIPADHYDPDDIKTYADVRTEDEVVTIQGRQLNVHFYRPLKDGPAIPAISLVAMVVGAGLRHVLPNSWPTWGLRWRELTLRFTCANFHLSHRHFPSNNSPTTMRPSLTAFVFTHR